MNSKPKILIGTSGFGYKGWKGSFYPEKISPKEMLRFYSEHLGSVEINNTFYHMPKESVLASWAEQVPDDFIFSFKAPQVITHLKQLRNAGSEIEYLFRSLSIIGRKLGPVLFQLPKSFKANKQVLEDFLKLIPVSSYCVFEFRNPSWINDEILAMLRERKFSICITDTDDQPAGEIISTAPWGYLRLRRSSYTDEELSKWKSKIAAQKWERAFVFFKHEDEARGAETAVRFRKMFN